jgi:hypothetical protein
LAVIVCDPPENKNFSGGISKQFLLHPATRPDHPLCFFAPSESPVFNRLFTPRQLVFQSFIMQELKTSAAPMTAKIKQMHMNTGR